jgi:DnaK suppressor protein
VAWKSGKRFVNSPRSADSPMPEPIPPEMLADLKAELERHLSRLERSMAVTDEAVRPVELDQQSVGRLSRMDSLQNQHMSQNLQEREQVRYGAIKAALKRWEAGTYGRCTQCGEPLAPGRLMVMPEVEHCSRCGG